MNQGTLAIVFLHIQPVFHSEYNLRSTQGVSTYADIGVGAERIFYTISVF